MTMMQHKRILTIIQLIALAGVTEAFQLHARGRLSSKTILYSPAVVSAPLQFDALFGTGIFARPATSTSDATSLYDAANNTDFSSHSPSTPEPINSLSSRLARLKDLMWVRECREDLTAAEFALTVENADNIRKRKRAVDYEKLSNQLSKRLFDLGCTFSSTGDAGEEEPFSCSLDEGLGAASMVYSAEQRSALMDQIIKTRHLLLEKSRQQLNKEEYDDEGVSSEDFSFRLPEIRVEIPKEDSVDPLSPGPKLYVRDDGTVDWDGALQDRDALTKFGTAVWARINGRDPESIAKDEASGGASLEGHGHGKSVTAKIEETEEIQAAKSKLDELDKELTYMERQHVDLLNSAISAGQAVANVNLASLAPPQRYKIRKSAEALVKQKEMIQCYTLIYELERIYSYLLGELGNPGLTGYIPLQDRLNVAEFGLMESQVESFQRQIDQGLTVDADVLAVVMEQLTDFKRRLGIDYYVTGLSFDGEAIRRFIADLWEQTKQVFAFYGKGCRLFWNDCLFCLILMNRAAQGYTLKPREVRTLRRTFKDVITFIPFVIILIIPLSPVGHVLVFGAIQRFFPEFFPSCFTEQRQNLLQLYETAEYSEFSINENWKEKLARASEAFLFMAGSASKAVWAGLVGFTQRKPQSKADEESKPSGQ
ncbi:hypothetical protein MPSEU_000212800 [Mayamaea pseudoterrestris]|nr:hypothetical protein MPSEU_000212800 [Mayamaea pseudoterrestris]